MPQRPAVSQLPPEIREDLERRLIQNGFADYRALAEWLAEQGFEISRSAIHRYGQEFERRLSAIKVATEQAKAIAGSIGDEEGAMNEALIRLCQQKAFDVLLNLTGEEDESLVPKMGVMVARLSRASVGQKKWQAEVNAKAAGAAAEITKMVKKQGLSDEAAEEIRRKILGIAE